MKRHIPLITPRYASEPAKPTKRWATKVPADHIRFNPSNNTIVLSKSFRAIVAEYPYLAIGVDEDDAYVTLWFNKEGNLEGNLGYKKENSNTIRTQYTGDIIDALSEFLQISTDKPNDFQATLSEKVCDNGIVYTIPFNKTTLF
jgi:hypothetical protein